MNIDRELARMDRHLEDIRRLIRERNEQTDRWRDRLKRERGS